jgi:UDPglucose 6-dehydrogenase
LLARAARHFGDLHGIRAAIWGLSFKPNTDDMREAPAVELIEGLLGKGAEVTAFDPVASTAARRVFRERIRIAERPYDAVEGADALFVMTEWNEFRHPDFVRMRALMRRPVIFDGRNVYAPARLRALGFTHHGIGRGHAADSRPD